MSDIQDKLDLLPIRDYLKYYDKVIQMVSTRGIKVKFTEGERVLCYEPDPTKAKVLYDSKVLQAVHTKDPTGRKQVEYLIHFQTARMSSHKNATLCKGWNASWDRRVSEDYVLKDTEENRELQKQLAEKAQIKLSIKSNRVLLGSGSFSKERKRRRRLSETIRETIERERQNRAESETSSQTGTATTEDDMESLSSSGMGSTTTATNIDHDDEEEDVSDDETFSKHAPIAIPDALRGVIEKDFFFINEKNKLVNLPSSKSVLSILEDYVRFYALRYLARSREKRRSEPKDKDKIFMTLDLCKEVIDGIRICFDFYVHSLLLYPRERQQAERLKNATPIKTEVFRYENENHVSNSVSSSKEDEEERQECKSNPTTKEKEDKKAESTPRRILRSKKPLTDDFSLVELKDVPRGQPQQQQPQHQPQQQPPPPPPPSSTTVIATTPTTVQQQQPQIQQQQHQPQALSCESGRSTPTTLTSGTSIQEGMLNYTSAGCRLKSPQQFKDLNNWTLLPLTHRVPPSPVLLYGPNHLLRLFVKMPEILYRMNVPGDRKKVILHHITLFLDYLALHIQDLFSDSNYINYVEN